MKKYICMRCKELRKIDMDKKNLDFVCKCGAMNWHEISDSLYYRKKFKNTKKLLDKKYSSKWITK